MDVQKYDLLTELKDITTNLENASNNISMLTEKLKHFQEEVKSTYDKPEELEMPVEKLEEFTKRCEKGIDVYASYDDVLTPGAIKAIEHFKSEDGTWEEAFEDWLYDQYNPIDSADEFMEGVKFIANEVGIDYDSLDQNSQQELQDSFSCNAYNKPDYEHYLKQELCIDIFIDSGDYNYDLGCNQVYPHYNGETGTPILDSCCLAWLSKKQGYSKDDLEKNLYSENKFDNKFFESVYDELANCASHMNALVFLKKMTLKEYLSILDGNDPISISKDTTCGLFDEWSGGGSLLEIKVEKDLEIFMDEIHKVVVDETFKYNIHDVYGVSDSFWN